MTVTVRPVHTTELAAVGDLTVAAYHADGHVHEDDPYSAALRDTATRAREAEVYVAELVDAPGVLAGTVTFCPQGSPWCELATDGDGEFRMLAVDPAFRRRGVAAALVSTCLERARELGYRGLVLSSLPAQDAAHRLYERLGFRRTPDLDWSPAQDIRLLAFRLDL